MKREIKLIGIVMTFIFTFGFSGYGQTVNQEPSTQIGKLKRVYELKKSKAPSIKQLSPGQPQGVSSSAPDSHVIKEGRTWRYYSEFNGKMNPDSNIYLDVTFSGTTQIDGREYLNCYVWKDTDDFSEANAALIAYMREEDGKVYARYIPEAYDRALEKGIDIIPYAPMMSNYNHDMDELAQYDVLLYDNSFKVGDVFYSMPDEARGERFIVDKAEMTECLGVDRMAWTLMQERGLNLTYSYYEGIGDIYGLLPFPSSVPITYDSYWWQLVDVTDVSGRVIFATAEMTTKVESIEDDRYVVKEILNSINGQEVKEPTNPGVYVRTQLLNDGSVRTNKIIVK